GRVASAHDAIHAIRAVWGRRVPAYRGSHYDIGGLVVEPRAARTDVPIWVGGRTKRSLRRAIELGDGWAPFSLSLDDVRAMLAWGRGLAAHGARTAPLAVVLSTGVDALADP